MESEADHIETELLTLSPVAQLAQRLDRVRSKLTSETAAKLEKFVNRLLQRRLRPDATVIPAGYCPRQKNGIFRRSSGRFGDVAAETWMRGP